MSTPKPLLKALDLRDGRACAWHWVGVCDAETLVPHHRANRGMGGRPSLHSIANLVWLCSSVNGLIESDHEWAVSARLRGIKISSHSDPDAEPITHAVHGRCFLNDDGTVTGAEKEVA